MGLAIILHINNRVAQQYVIYHAWDRYGYGAVVRDTAGVVYKHTQILLSIKCVYQYLFNKSALTLNPFIDT